MALKNILVHLDDSHHSAARLDLAIRLAQRRQARLTALYIITHPHYEPQHADTEAKTTQLRSGFNASIAESGIKAELLAVDCKVSGIGVSEVVILHAYYSDLVIVGQSERKSDGNTPADLPERVVLGSGRPVLIVPYAGSYMDIGKRALVAWRSGRESARAVNDAIPLLTKAGAVSILIVNPAEQARNEGEQLCAHLACHDIPARAEHAVATDISVGDAILNRASVEGSDLLVMGAYALTRFGAPTLGDVARHILKHMTVPVLMSH